MDRVSVFYRVLFIGFYFAGGIRDLEETQGKGTSQGLKVSLWVTAALTFVSMVSLGNKGNVGGKERPATGGPTEGKIRDGRWAMGSGGRWKQVVCVTVPEK